jgi:cellulose biosynthesis protein BcsQ
MTVSRKRSNLEFKAKLEDQPFIEKIKNSPPVSVCFFNNKGGVGKTTLLANLAANLAKNFDLKILVVDADPQCNLTQYVLSDDQFFSTYDDDTRDDISTIYSVIHPLSIGKGYLKDLPIIKSENFGIDIIIGDPRLALKEDLLAQDWRDAKAGGIRGIRTTLVFSDLIAKADGYDLILFDMGPSLGAINRSILLTTDGFVVPMSIDIFSSWALKNIGSAIEQWKREFKNGLSMAESPSEIPMNIEDMDKTIKFFGYVMQQHKEMSQEGSPKTVAAYEKIKVTLPLNINKYLKGYYLTNNFEPNIGEIRHLASLAPKSQTDHMPMISIVATGSYTTLRKKARMIYLGLSQRFIRNIASYIDIRG